jgi:catechol 2,3-dioxygenase-like lactoylglutathione lyase family enzyme
MNIKKLTPVLYVEHIEPCLAFWTRLGFEKTVEVPHEDTIGFVILKKDDTEIMYQSWDSVAADIPSMIDSPAGGTFLFIEVDDVDYIDRTLSDVPRVIPRRKTFYGADEVIVREPGDNVVTFAQMPPEGV